MELLLIRHGEPVRIESAGGAGVPADPSLSERGGAQATRLARWLAEERLDHVCVSPLRRAIETARPLAEVLGLTPQVVKGLAEFDAAADEYIPMEELRRVGGPRFRAMVEGRWSDLGLDIDPDAFNRGVIETLEGLVVAHPGEVVAAVCHGGVINLYLSYILGTRDRLWFEPAYTSITRVVAARTGERTVVSVNESAHLRGL